MTSVLYENDLPFFAKERLRIGQVLNLFGVVEVSVLVNLLYLQLEPLNYFKPVFFVQYGLLLVIYVLWLLWKSINTLCFRKISTPFQNVCNARSKVRKTRYLELVFVHVILKQDYILPSNNSSTIPLLQLDITVFYFKLTNCIGKLTNSSCRFHLYFSGLRSVIA